MGVYGNLSRMAAVYSEYIQGGDPPPYHEEILESLPWLEENDLKNGKYSFSDLAHQSCSDLVFDIEFQGKKLYWHQMNESIIGPLTVGTDYGTCCLIVPQVLTKQNLINI